MTEAEITAAYDKFRAWTKAERDLTSFTPLEAFRAGVHAAQLATPVAPDGYKLVPIFATREICCAIEAIVENQATASGMCCEMHRLDGDYIWDAAITAAPQGAGQ
jgi:hypothetical protein